MGMDFMPTHLEYMRNILKLVVIIMGYALCGSSQSAIEILPPEKIVNLIPDKIKEFHLSTDPQSKLIRLGTLRYSMAEKNFSGSHKRSIKILLFDYKEAPIMYNQATRKFNTFTPVESDSLIMRSVLMSDCTGWESYNINRRSSQILLGVCNRFFLTVEGTNVDLEFLKKVVQNFKFETFPK